MSDEEGWVLIHRQNAPAECLYDSHRASASRSAICVFRPSTGMGVKIHRLGSSMRSDHCPPASPCAVSSLMSPDRWMSAECGCAPWFGKTPRDSKESRQPTRNGLMMK